MIQKLWNSDGDCFVEGKIYTYDTFNLLDEIKLKVKYDTLYFTNGNEVTMTVEEGDIIELLDDGVYGFKKKYVFSPKDDEQFRYKIREKFTVYEPDHVPSNSLFLFNRNSEQFELHYTDCDIEYDGSYLIIRDGSNKEIVCQKSPMICADRMYRSLTWTYTLGEMNWVFCFRFREFNTYQNLITSINNKTEENASLTKKEGFDMKLLDLEGNTVAYLYSDGVVKRFKGSDSYIDNEKSETLIELPSDVDPNQIMLHNRETELVLPTTDHNISLLNTEGRVIREWKDMDYPITRVSNKRKFSQLDMENTFLCINSLGIMDFDTRTKKGITLTKMYEATSRPLLSCISVSTQGDIITGSKKGEIRIYDNYCLFHRSEKPRAKITYSGFGDTIFHIDVSKDDKWIACTCREYIVLIEGCREKMKSNPLQLRLDREDNRYLHPIRLTHAKFDKDRGDRIITSTGKYAIMWSYSPLTREWIYEIKDYNEKDIIGQDYKLDSSSPVFVT